MATESSARQAALFGLESAAQPVQAAQPSGAQQFPFTVIEAGQASRWRDLKELWHCRDLFCFLAWRDVAVRYKQTILGILWAVIQPVMSMAVLSVFFGRLAGFDQRTGGLPYPVFVYAGLLPWTLFSQSVSRSSESLIGSAQLITKVYFPRLVLPAAATGACLLDFLIACTVLAGMMLAYGVAPSASALLFPAFLLLTVAAALGVGTLVAALNVAYRDFRYVVPFAMQLWMLATPAIYAEDLLPARWQWLTAINPMNGVVQGWRSCILGGRFEWTEIGVSAAVVTATLALGLAYFRRTERQFADVI